MIDGDFSSYYKKAWTLQLYREFDDICFQYSAKLRKPTIQISDSNSWWGKWDPLLRCIYINTNLIKQYDWTVVIEIFKHEIAHQFAQEILSSKTHHHDELFHCACEQLAVAHWARRATGDISKTVGPDTKKSAQLTKIEAKLAKLQALSQSSNENEAFLAMHMAKKLQEKFQIEPSNLSDSEDYTFRRICHEKKSIPHHQLRLASLLCEHYLVDIVFQTSYCAKKTTTYKSLEIIGRKENVELAEYLYFYVWNRLPLMWQAYKRQAGAGANRKSYLLGVIAGLAEKLESDKEHNLSQQEVEVRALQSQTLNLAIRKRYPKLRQTSQRSRFRDMIGYSEGQKNGRRLAINKGIKQSNPQKLLLR
ncbi:MAG: DUF2786 domain-containing protein [Pseudobacteriovorax sp.]|nr:DUF2786 domain-containing protein [Pseudobacteriovorax sp.]